MGKRNGKPYVDYKSFKSWCFSILGDSCVICKSTVSLEIDHIDRNTKSFVVTTFWAKKPIQDIELELSKCQVLCSSCHKAKSIIELRASGLKQGRTHGTGYVYMKLKCQCGICLIAKQNYYNRRNSLRRLSGESGKGAYKQPTVHGTYLMYTRKCRCIQCKKAKASYEKERRNNTKSNVKPS